MVPISEPPLIVSITNITASEGLLPKPPPKDTSNAHFCTSEVQTILDREINTILIRDCNQGVLQNGKMVAVEKLVQSMSSSREQFENEVNLLMKLKHTNIVQLLGYCYETQHLRKLHEGKFIFAWNTECLLCLECLPKGSLDIYISGMAFNSSCFSTFHLSLRLQFSCLIIVPKNHILMNEQN